MLAASPLLFSESVEPAPTMLCNSSMNKTMLGSLLALSITFLSLSSKLPRRLEPATMSLIFTEIMCMFAILAGTLPEAILSAKPSTIEVLPTPAGPIKTGLFFLRLDKISITLSICSSRPITGSNLLFFASSTKSSPIGFSFGF